MADDIETDASENDGEYIEDNDERYKHCMYALQKKAGLTFREARAYLSRYRETSKSLADEWNTSVENVYNLIRKAHEKVDASGLTEKQLFGNMSMRRCFID
jgi:DNA-binding CsgD family transcriptional regulator